MAIEITSQYSYTGRGPLDAKALVKTYAELLLETTWHTKAGKISAYNGMIVAVWLNTADTSKNGVYFLHDANVKSTFATPDVTKEENWHRLGGIENLSGLSEQITSIQTALTEAQSDIDELQDSATEVVDIKSDLPRPGVAGKIYVVTEEAMTYVWYNNDYLPVGDGGDTEEIQIIMGGGPTA